MGTELSRDSHKLNLYKWGLHHSVSNMKYVFQLSKNKIRLFELEHKINFFEKLWVSLKPHKYKLSNANVQINRELHKEAWMCTYRKLRMSKQDSISTQKPIFSQLSSCLRVFFYWSKFLLLISQQFSSVYSGWEIAWPHFWSTGMHSQQMVDFCQKN